MVNRKEIELERFIDEIDHTWKLSVTETELLEDVLNAIRTESFSEIKKIIDFWENSDFEELLDMIPNYAKESWASYNGFIDEYDCPAQKTLEDFDDDEIEQEYFDRFDRGCNRIDIVTDSQYKEMSDLFLSLDFISRENILKQLRK